MRPDVPAVLNDHAKRLAERIAPQLTGFDANSVMMISFMLTMTAEEWDRAASRRVEENAAIRAVFKDAADAVRDPGLAKRIQELAATADTDLRIAALETANNRLRAALADLHAHVESIEGADARRIEEVIWSELRRSVDRRRVAIANF